jgi:hypothetical protein
MAVINEVMVSWAVMPCSVEDRNQSTSTLNVKAAGFSKVLVPSTILHDIITKNITYSITYFIPVLLQHVNIHISESKQNMTVCVVS